MTEADKAAHAATIEGILKAHEVYKQEVSDAVEAYNDLWRNRTPGRDEFMGHFTRFIIPKPDPLVEAVGEAMQEHEVYSEYELTESLHKALAKRGLKIVETATAAEAHQLILEVSETGRQRARATGIVSAIPDIPQESGQ